MRLAGQQPGAQLSQLVLAAEGLQAKELGTFTSTLTTYRRVQVFVTHLQGWGQHCTQASHSTSMFDMHVQEESQGQATVKAAKDLSLITFKSQPEVLHMILR